MFGNTNNNAVLNGHICGLYYTTGTGWNVKRTYLPQVDLSSHTTINPVCFTTQLTQTFRNPNREALPKVQYAFPLYDGVAVNGYTIRYADKVLTGVVKQKDEAKKTYQAAVDRGETAGLLESLPAGIFGVTLGNVPANTDVVVDITYCGELKHDAAIDGLRYMLPTSIAPRYGEYPGQLLTSNTTAKKGIRITVDVDMATSAIRKIQSPSHPIAVSMGATSTTENAAQAPFQPSQASATLTLGTTELGGDFILQLLIDDISKPQAIVETHPTLPNQRAIMATLVPKFTLAPAHPEIVFIADQSGSMSGSKNAALVTALKIFLKSLPLGVRFNICAFGNHFRFLWPKSQAYNEANVNAAETFVNGFTASYGGTEILQPIQAAFEARLKDLPLEVMLLTDGEVWAEESVFAFINEQIREKKVDARVFGLGIGNDVSHTLVEGVARAGNGFAQFVAQNEETDQKVVRMLKGALYAHTKDYALEVHYEDEKGAQMSDDDDFEIVEKVNDCLNIADLPPSYTSSEKDAPAKSFFDTSADPDKASEPEGNGADRYAHLPKIDTPKLLQAPSDIPPLFPFNRTTVYLLLGPDSPQKHIKSVTIRATSLQGPLELSVPVHTLQSRNDIHGSIHQLAARKAIQDLEEGRGWIQTAKTTDGSLLKTKHESRFDELVERECVQLGEKFQVASKWTSFVAVQERDEDAMDVEEEGKEHKGGVRGRINRLSSAVKGKKRGKAVGSSATLADKEGEDEDVDDDDADGFRYVHAVPSGVVAVAPSIFEDPRSLFARPGTTASGFGTSHVTRDRCVDMSHHSESPTGGLFGNPARAGFGRRSAASDRVFGQLHSSAPSAGGLFGSAANTGGGLFGSGPAQPQTSGLFANANTSGGSLFGNATAPQSNTSTGGLFGNAQNQGGALFGKPVTPGTTLTDTIDPELLEVYAREMESAASMALGDEDDADLLTPTSSSAATLSMVSQRGEALDALSSQYSSATAMAGSTRRTRQQQQMPSSPPQIPLSFGGVESYDPTIQDSSYDPTIEDSYRSAAYVPGGSSFGPGVGLGAPPPSAPSAAPLAPMARRKKVALFSRGGGAAPAAKAELFSAKKKSMPSLGWRSSKASKSFASVAAPAAKEGASNSPGSALHNLIAQQAFSGAWPWSDELFAAIGLSRADVDTSAIVGTSTTASGGEVNIVGATALAVAYFETRLADKKDVWEMVVAKARAWLAGKVGAEGVDGVVARAAKCLPADA